MDPAVNHLQRLACGTQSVCPSLARYFFERSVKYVCNRSERSKIENDTMFSRCSFCYNRLKLGNNSMKLSPKPRFTKEIKRLMKNVEQNNQRLGNYQKKLIQDYINKPNKLVIVCALCKKSRVVKCQSRLERQKQKKSVEKDRDLQIQEELPVVEPIKSRNSKKKERRKLLRQKHQHGDLDDDKNAGLLLPSDKVHNEKPEESKTEPEFRIESENEDNEEAVHTVVSNKTASMSDNKNSVRKDKLGTNTDIKHETHSGVLSNIACKPSFKKTSGTANNDLDRLSSIINGRKVAVNVKGQKSLGLMKDLSSPGKNQRSVVDKKKKAKQMSQQLGRLLKQEKKSSSDGSLTDFLSSL